MVITSPSTTSISSSNDIYRVKLPIGSKVLWVFCFEICTAEGREGEKGGNANFTTKHKEPLAKEIPSALYNS